jgi:hypothetical protein
MMLAGMVAALLLTGAVAWSPRSLHAQQPGDGTPVPPATPRFARFGKTYINLGQVTHVVSDPDPGLPPGALQVHFGQHSVLLHGEEADSLRRVLEGEGIVQAQAYQARPAAAPTTTPSRVTPPATAKPAPVTSGVGKKPAVRKVIQADVP